jgi:hypothetical protein
MITDGVMALLERHAADPNSGYNRAVLDFSEQGRAERDADIMRGIQEGNLMEPRE